MKFNKIISNQCNRNFTKKIKVLLLSSKYQPEYSGSGLRAHNTYKRLKKKYDINFDVVTSSISFQGNRIYKYEGKKIYRISPPFKIKFQKGWYFSRIKNKNPFRFIKVFLWLSWEIYYSWNYIKKNINQYDLLHTFGNSWSIGFLSWYFAKNNKPIIRELCNEMSNPLYPILFRKIMKKIFKKDNTLVVAISRKLEILAKKFEMKNVWMRPNPIDENKFFVDFKNKFQLRNKLTKFNSKDILLSYIANYRLSKNHIFLIDVLSLLPKKYKMILRGPLKDEGQEYFNEIKEKIDKFKLHNRIDIQSGYVGNFDEYLKCSDIFLFPSLTEGLGTPILESQACGVPVIANNLKNVVDIYIKNGKGGNCLELDAYKWAKTIEKVIKIKKKNLIKNSLDINSKASSSVIDKEYFKRINNLIN